MNSKNKKVVWANVLVWSIPIIFIFTLAYFAFLQHDIYLWQLNHSLHTLKNPSGTQRIASSKDLGLLVANGNHCDYFVAEFRSYPDTFSSQQIQAFYKNTKIWNPLNRRKETVSVGIIKNGKIESNEDWTGTGEFLKSYFSKSLPSKLNHQHFYFVFFLDIGNGTACDIRCM